MARSRCPCQIRTGRCDLAKDNSTRADGERGEVHGEDGRTSTGNARPEVWSGLSVPFSQMPATMHRQINTSNK